MKSLEEQGFTLEFSRYQSNEEQIIELIKEHNERLFLALPLLLRYEFSYKNIINKINKEEKALFIRIILIAHSIFQTEKIEHEHIKRIIQHYHLSATITKEEHAYYALAFKDALQRKANAQEKAITTQINMRTTLHLNKALSLIYSPAKRRIMEKIFNHELLTNTELKYYYRAIRPLCEAILNESLQKYLRIIWVLKKYS